MSSLYQKRGIYYYQGRDGDGNRVQRSLKTKDREEAKLKKEELDKQFDREEPDPLSVLAEEYLKRRWQKVGRGELAERTVETDEYALRIFLRWMDGRHGTVFSDELGRLDLQAFKRERLSEVAPTTVGNNLRHVQSFFSHLRKRGEIEGDPLEGIEIPKPRRRDVVPTEREFELLKGWLEGRIREAEEPKMIHLLMKLACHTGMRLGELARLKWERGAEDVGTGHSRSYVYLTEEEKTITIKFKRKLRVIPAEHVWGTIERLKERREEGAIYVFASPRTDSHYTVSSLCHKWKREVEKIDGLSRPYTSHSIRHGVVTHLLREGVPVYEVGKIVGHSSEKITERYSHFIPSDLSDAMALLG